MPLDPAVYEETLQTMYSLQRFGIKLGLDTIRALLAGMGNPHRHYRCIHIAGTNGKGSVAAMLAEILRRAGTRVGMYTSPHLVRFNERIQINGTPITDEDVYDLYHRLRRVNLPDRETTFFELTTALAMAAFQQHDVEWAIMETGMGGRLDATNVVDPELSIITNVSLEHQEYLGNRLADIAFEKGGIIKPGVPVVTGVRQKQAVAVLEQLANDRRAPIYRLGRDFRIRKTGDAAFSFYGRAEPQRDIRPGLVGEHQRENTALVLAACETLHHHSGLALAPDTVRAGIAATRWPGRLEVVSDNPLVILDGAHNLAAARKLADYLKTRLSDRRITLVIGILDDKPYRRILETLVSACHRVILTQPDIYRSLAPEALREQIDDLIDNIEMVPKVSDALEKAMNEAGATDAVCVAGSLYVVGEAKEALDLSTRIE